MQGRWDCRGVGQGPQGEDRPVRSGRRDLGTPCAEAVPSRRADRGSVPRGSCLWCGVEGLQSLKAAQVPEVSWPIHIQAVSSDKSLWRWMKRPLLAHGHSQGPRPSHLRLWILCLPCSHTGQIVPTSRGYQESRRLSGRPLAWQSVHVSERAGRVATSSCPNQTDVSHQSPARKPWRGREGGTWDGTLGVRDSDLSL